MSKKIEQSLALVALAAGLMVMPSCSKTEKTISGVAIGATAGGLIGSAAGGTPGALIGAGIGGTAGGLIGSNVKDKESKSSESHEAMPIEMTAPVHDMSGPVMDEDGLNDDAMSSMLIEDAQE